MDQKQLFHEALTSFIEYCAVKGNKITMEDVKLHFQGLIEDDSQYRFIYDYLAANKITVEGFKPDMTASDSLQEYQESSSANEISPSAEDMPESEEELAFIEMYMQELQSVKKYSTEEIDQLITQLNHGDLSVVNALVESFLPMTAEIADSYRGKGATFGDLIQEGNLALMLAISDYTKNDGDFTQFIRNQITSAMEQAVNSQINSQRISHHLADQLNRLDEVTRNLSEKLGRVPDVSELAEAMSISQEQVEILLKTSLDTLSVNEDTHITDEKASDINSAPETKDPLEWRVNKK